MLRKMILIKTLVAVVFAAGATFSIAQTTTVEGKVELKKADGQTEPLKGVRVDCYRADTSLKCRSSKTNGRGEFTFLGIPFNGSVILAVSGEGIGPTVYPNIKAGTTDVVITVSEGNGEVLTEEKVRETAALYSANPTGELTEEQKKAQEEFDKKVAEISAKNEKIKQKTLLIEAALKAGNEAYNAGDYALAVERYDEGIEADPDFVGSAPVLLSNKGAVLKKRAVNVYNTAAKTRDQEQIKQGRAKAAADLAAALKSYYRAYKILSNAKPTDITNPAKHKEDTLGVLNGARESIRIMVQIKAVDPEQTAAVREATAAYLKVEQDKTKQAKAQVNLGAYLLDGADYDGAVIAYKKAFDFSPKDPDVLGGLGLSLFMAGDINGSREQKQESLNYMDVYLKVAPGNHKFRQGVADLVDILLKEEKMKPQKIN